MATKYLYYTLQRGTNKKMLAYCNHEWSHATLTRAVKTNKILLHNIHVTDPFLTVTSWFLELCTGYRPIFHVKNSIF